MKYREYEYPRYYDEFEGKNITDYSKLAEDMVMGRFPRVKLNGTEIDVVFQFPTDPDEVREELEDAYRHDPEEIEGVFNINDPDIVENASGKWCSRLSESSDWKSFIEPSLISDCDGDNECLMDEKWAFLDGCKDAVLKITNDKLEL